jgi:hypothetical protein
MRALSLLLFLPLFATAQTPGAEPPPAATVIADPAHDPAWQPLFERLAAPHPRFSPFEEARTFPFRKTPIVLRGEIRIVPGRGLSLHYDGDESHVVIIDTQGVLLRDENGRDHPAPSDARSDAITSALFHVLRFDLAALAREFTVRGARTDDAWTLAFEPHDPDVAKFIGTISVSGHADLLDRIAMVKSERQRIDITLHDTQTDVIFTSDALRRYFR